jgi:hypothetical protein
METENNQNKLKGGEEKMAQISSEKIILKCKYCEKEMPPSLYERQAKSWLDSHESNCYANPSNKENGKQ